MPYQLTTDVTNATGGTVYFDWILPYGRKLTDGQEVSVNGCLLGRLEEDQLAEMLEDINDGSVTVVFPYTLNTVEESSSSSSSSSG